MEHTKTKKSAKREKKIFGRYREPLTDMPDLVEAQVTSFKWLVEEGLKEVFQEFSSIKDFSERKFQLDFVGFELAEPKYNEYEAKELKLSYEAPLKVKVSRTSYRRLRRSKNSSWRTSRL
jgi:DNA-directed RNA polymerase subunit beta